MPLLRKISAAENAATNLVVNRSQLLECLAVLPHRVTMLVFQEIVELEKRAERAEAMLAAFREHRIYREHDPEWKREL